ncbi:MAG: NUDIX domain-containing protein, partial [Candidatus Scalindua sp.]|nr:NUDIX domain-containing protein [Candidatus Scalindua sp.]
MDELIDLVNEDGSKTGKTCLKSLAHKNGFMHSSVHIWIFDVEKNVLIQKRAIDKDCFPNLWDVSVAGHISAGETPIISALREIHEEIGLKVSKTDLLFLSSFRKNVRHSEDFIDNELHHIYICNLNFNLIELIIQESEVSEVTSIPLNKLISKINSSYNSFVPHGKNYYKLVFNFIESF